MPDQHDLKTLDSLRSAASDPLLAKNPAEVAEWTAALAATLEWFAAADEETRQSREAQWRLWEQNRVAAVGQGSISVEAALDDAEFRRWFARRSFD